MNSAVKINYLEKQRRLFAEAHSKGFTNRDIARLIGASEGFINNCATCSSALLSGLMRDEFINKCRLRGFARELAEEMGYIVLDDPATITSKMKAEAKKLRQKLKKADEALKMIAGE